MMNFLFFYLELNKPIFSCQSFLILMHNMYMALLMENEGRKLVWLLFFLFFSTM